MSSNFVSKSEQRNRLHTAVPLLTAILAVILIVLFCSMVTVSRTLVVDDGKILLSMPIKSGECFYITYTHSVNKTPVTDTIEYTGSELVVRESLFQSFGAGISVGDDIGQKIIFTEDGLLMTGIDTPYDRIDLMTGTYADHKLIFHGKEYRLKDYAGEQKHVTIYVRKRTIFGLLAK